MAKGHMPWLRAALAAVVACAAPAALAQQSQQYPARLVTFVVSWPAGGGPDLAARTFAQAFEPVIGQRVVIENRPGAGGYTGAEYVARATADGYTLLYSSFAGLHGSLFAKDLPVDLPSALVPVGQVGDAPQFLMVPASIPARNLKEFVSYVKANPKRLNVAVIGNTTIHLNTLLFLQVAGIDKDVTVIPYPRSPEVSTAMLRGEVHLFWIGFSSLKSGIDAGKIVPIAVSTGMRTELAPEVATIKEQGFDLATSASNSVILGPAGMRRDLVVLLSRKIGEALATPGLRDKLKPIGYVLTPATHEELAVTLAKEVKAMREAAATAGLKPQ